MNQNIRSTVVTLFSVIFIITIACSGKKTMTQPAVPVLTGQALVQPMPLTLQAVGSVEPIESVAIKPQVGGVITQVHFTEGQHVRSGQPLFQIDPRPFQVALDAATAQLARDHAQLRNTEIQAKRYSDLNDKEYVTQEQYDAIRTQMEMFKSAVQVDQAAIDQARLNMSWAAITAPISGLTGSLLIKRGNVVKANDAALVVINQLHPIRIRFAIPGTQLPLLQKYAGPGSLPVRAWPSRNGDSLAVTGKLIFIDNAVDDATGTVTLKAEFSNEQNVLWPGQFVDVEIELYLQPDALTVPATAVLTGQSGSFVYVVTKNKTVEKRTVHIDRTVKNVTVIESGLQAGETVVTDGQMRLTPGAKIEMRSSLSDLGRS
jgi:membrane fusion protein, multidrug efflux system